MAIRTEGADDLQRLADALKAAGDKDLQKQVSKAMRDEARPLGQKVLVRGSEDLPQRGGLAERVRDMGRVGVSSSLRGRAASVQVILRNKGADLKSMDGGIVRHRVFGSERWVAQQIRAGAFTRAFEAESGEVREAALKGAQKALDDAARKV